MNAKTAKLIRRYCAAMRLPSRPRRRTWAKLTRQSRAGLRREMLEYFVIPF